MRNFSYQPNPSRIVFGAGSLDGIADECARLDISRALIVSSPGRRKLAERAEALLGARAANNFDGASGSLSASDFDAALAARRDADGLVVIGGGSAIGLGKSLGAKTGLRQIAVPSTYSGSELMTDWRIEGVAGIERGNEEAARPATLIYDAELTLDLPPGVSGPSGGNALAHAIESMYSPNVNPVAFEMGAAGIAALAESLPVFIAEPANLAARERALYGAWACGGFRAGSCLEHRIAQRMRTLFGLTHAESHAVVLPYVVAFNEAAAPEAMARIARALGSESAADGMFRLNDTLGVKPSMKEIGVPEDGLDAAADDIAGVEIPNPRPVSRDDVRALIDDAFHGRRPR